MLVGCFGFNGPFIFRPEPDSVNIILYNFLENLELFLLTRDIQIPIMRVFICISIGVLPSSV